MLEITYTWDEKATREETVLLSTCCMFVYKSTGVRISTVVGEEGVGSRDDLICPHCQSNDLRKSWKRRQSEYKFNMQVLQCKNHDLMAVVS